MVRRPLEFAVKSRTWLGGEVELGRGALELADWEEALIHLDSDHTGNVGYYTPRAPTPGRRHH